jgi:hypothetical protein
MSLFPLFDSVEPFGRKAVRSRFASSLQTSARWILSSILHGEQGALNLCRLRSATCCAIQGAQEYAANQTREEARHVTGFAEVHQGTLGPPLPVASDAEAC